MQGYPQGGGYPQYPNDYHNQYQNPPTGPPTGPPPPGPPPGPPQPPNPAYYGNTYQPPPPPPSGPPGYYPPPTGPTHQHPGSFPPPPTGPTGPPTGPPLGPPMAPHNAPPPHHMAPPQDPGMNQQSYPSYTNPNPNPGPGQYQPPLPGPFAQTQGYQGQAAQGPPTQHNQSPGMYNPQPTHGYPQPPPRGVPPPPDPIEQLNFQALSLHKPALGPNAGRFIGSENFPRFTLEHYHDQDINQSLPVPVLPYFKPCSSRVIRATNAAIPNSAALAAKWPLPIGAVINPMGKIDDLPVVNFATLGNVGVIRCKSCAAYINPYAQWTDGGRRWVCNLCQQPNVVPQEYYCALDANGIRRDIASRPELTNASVEFVAPSEYMVRPPQRPIYVFVIDVSNFAVTSGVVHYACETLRTFISSLPGEDRTMVSIITFDSTVHFYNLKSTLSSAKMMVMPEFTSTNNLDQIQVPLPDDLLVSSQESRSVIEDLLGRIPTMFAKNSNVESAFGPALCAALKLMSHLGGKLVAFLSGIPSLGIGRLRNRDDKRLYGTPKEVTLLQSADDWYKERALQCSNDQICVDMFLTPPSYMDVATVGQLAKVTGGQIYYFKNFSAERGDGVRLQKDLERLMTRETGFEAVMRIRCTLGTRITNFLGHFNIRGQDLLALPNIDEDRGFAIQVQHPPNHIMSSNTFCIQCALLYTTSSGERRIRSHTICLPVTASLPEVFKSVDLPSTSNLLLRTSIEQAMQTSLESTRNAIVDKTINALKLYKTCLSQAHRTSNQLFLPDSLKLLPAYVTGILKNISIRNDPEVTPDERVACIARASTISCKSALSFYYPALYDVIQTIHQEKPVLVPTCSIEALDGEGIYLLDTSWYLAIWIGRKVNEDIVRVLFGADFANAKQLLPRNKDNKLLWDLIDTLQYPGRGPGCPPVVVVKQTAPIEKLYVGRFLVEDEFGSAMSYPNFLYHLHRRIQASG